MQLAVEPPTTSTITSNSATTTTTPHVAPTRTTTSLSRRCSSCSRSTPARTWRPSASDPPMKVTIASMIEVPRSCVFSFVGLHGSFCLSKMTWSWFQRSFGFPRKVFGCCSECCQFSRAINSNEDTKANELFFFSEEAKCSERSLVHACHYQGICLLRHTN